MQKRVRNGQTGPVNKKRKMTLGDVATKLGVSRTTVSLVISKHPRISKATSKKVWKCIKELGYQPDLVARSLATGRSNLIGLIVPDSSNPFFAEIFRGAEDAARQYGWHLMLNNGSFDLKVEEDRIRDLLGLKIGGLLACPAFVSSEDSRQGIWEELRQQGLPVVLLNRQVFPQIFHQIAVDNTDGIRQAIAYLVGLGHRRIGVIKPDTEILPVHQRMDEVRRQMAGFQLELPQEWIAGGPVSLAGGHDAARILWQATGKKPTAVFALTDTMALGALRYFTESGLKVPEQVSLLGMDGTPYAQYSLIPISSVETSLFDLGRMSVEMLHKVIEQDDSPQLYSTIMPMRLIERASSGPPPRES